MSTAIISHLIQQGAGERISSRQLRHHDRSLIALVPEWRSRLDSRWSMQCQGLLKQHQSGTGSFFEKILKRSQQGPSICISLRG